MISRRILSISIALALAGITSFAVASQYPKLSAYKKAHHAHAKKTKFGSPETTVVATPAAKGEPGESPDHPIPEKYTDQAITYFGGTPVVSSPYLGLRSEFDGSDLITNLSSVNEDMRLLGQRRAFDLELKRTGKRSPEAPLLELSGKIEAIAMHNEPFVGRATNDIDLASSELDIAGYFAKSILGFMAIKYDSSTGTFNRRIDNSRIFLDKAFLTVGDLIRSPFYATIGQLYVPFGRYSGFMVSSPLPLSLGRTKARAAVLGFKQVGDNNFYGQAYYFRGDTHLNKGSNGGLNLGYDFSNSRVHGAISTGIISNIADSSGLQGGGGDGFQGFSHSAEDLVHKVHGFAINGKFGVGSFSFLGEYVTGLSRFDVSDFAFNGVGARPSALDLEAAYLFKVYNSPSNIAIGYGKTKQALALNLPKESYLITFNTSLWKDTIQSLEFRHDKNYGVGSSAFGRGGDEPFPSAGLGASANILTIQVGAYC